MEYQVSTVILALLIILYCLLRCKNTTSTKKTPPQPSGAWPVIGHLHLLEGLPHIFLAKLADKYGPIFMLKLGLQKALVVSSPAMAKECLGTNDRVFVDRPQTVLVEHLAYKSAMIGFSPYGPYWREIRKITIVELLSNQRLETFRDARMSHVRSAVKGLYDKWNISRKSDCGSDTSDASAPVDMKLWFRDITLNNIVRLIAGKSLREFYRGDDYEKISKALREVFELAGVFVPADALPFLRWFDIGGYERAMKKVGVEIEHMAEEWLEDHKRRRLLGEVMEKQDFIDVLLRIFETPQDKASDFEVDAIIKATSMAMILAATDTSAVALTWALSLLLNNKDVMTKIQAELDTFVGKERQVDEADLKNLVYLQAVVKETLRLYAPAPLSVPRQSVTDCTVNGYHIPAGTQVLVNLYMIHRDPDSWEDPYEFRPERFLATHKDHDVSGLKFDFMPFGSGRRICPGRFYAVQVMQFTLATLIQGFEMSTPTGSAVDMTEGAGLTTLKATPLEVILTPRLADHLYNSSSS